MAETKTGKSTAEKVDQQNFKPEDVSSPTTSEQVDNENFVIDQAMKNKSPGDESATTRCRSFEPTDQQKVSKQ
jgi:hypothetical protein